MISSNIPVERIDDLQARYIAALDDQDMNAWLSTFSGDPESSYICTTQENERRGLPLALMLDDCRGRLEDRVTYITKIWAGTFQNYRTRHLAQRMKCKDVGDGQVEVVSNFSVYCTPDETGVSMLLATGIYVDRMVKGREDIVFMHKKVIMDTYVVPRYLVYPI